MARPSPTGQTIRNISARKLLAKGLVAMLVLTGSTAVADTEIEMGGGAKVENVRIDAAKAGGDAQIRLLIVNEGQTALHLRGISSVAAQGSRIDTEIDSGKSIELNMLTIPPNETLDFETFHQRLFLSRLKRNLEPGQELKIRFHFLEGELSAVAHVH